MTMYADDTSLCHQSHDLTQLNEAINSDLKKINTGLTSSFFYCIIPCYCKKVLNIMISYFLEF